MVWLRDEHHLAWLAADTWRGSARPVPDARTWRVVRGFLRASRTLRSCAAIAAGGQHTCAVRAEDGELVCFGLNEDGQCTVPPGLGPVAAVAAGAFHTCAIRAEDGRLVCFGRNDWGQCTVPPGLGPVVAVSASPCHTCAVLADGSLVCFGRNGDGQCSPPADLGPVLAVCCTPNHTCVVKADGRLVCFGNPQDRIQRWWGSREVRRSRDLGYGPNAAESFRGQVRGVATGAFHTAVVKADGHMVCLGRHNFGQCSVPPDLGEVTAVACGPWRTSAISEGRWRTFGRLAHREDAMPWGGPNRVLEAPGAPVAAVAVAEGWYHTVLAQADGKLVAFGENNEGQCDVPAGLGPVKME